MDKPAGYVTSHPGQLSLAITPWPGAMSTSEGWDNKQAHCMITGPVSVVWH